MKFATVGAFEAVCNIFGGEFKKNISTMDIAYNKMSELKKGLKIVPKKGLISFERLTELFIAELYAYICYSVMGFGHVLAPVNFSESMENPNYEHYTRKLNSVVLRSAFFHCKLNHFFISIFFLFFN